MLRIGDLLRFSSLFRVRRAFGILGELVLRLLFRGGARGSGGLGAPLQLGSFLCRRRLLSVEETLLLGGCGLGGIRRRLGRFRRLGLFGNLGLFGSLGLFRLRLIGGSRLGLGLALRLRRRR